MSNKKMQEILKDLYLIDPSLKKDEEKIISIVEDIIKNQPNIELDQEFVIQLKEKVFLEIESLENKKELSFFSWQNVAYVSFSSVFIVVLSVFVFTNFLFPTKRIQDQTTILALNERAFGDLSLSFEQAGDAGEIAMNNQEEGEILGLGSTDEYIMDIDLVSSDDLSIMPYPIEQNNYRYVYKGDFLDNLDLSSISNLVYKRSNNNNLAKIFANNLKNVSAIPFNLNNLTQTEIQHLNISENKDYGYSVSLNLSNNSLSVYTNWQNWPQPYKDCFDDGCYDSLRLKFSDMLSESEIISIANNFVYKYGVNVNDYGNPEISRDALNQITTAANDYYPEHVSIVYPLKIDENNVFSSQGGKEGLEISVDLRQKRVSSLYNLNFSSIESSPYNLIDNLEKVDELLNRGGLNPDYYYGNNNNKINYIEVELGEPKIALVKTWLSSSRINGGVDIFIPSLIFTIKERPNEYFNRQNVIIPLIDEIFEESLKQANNQIYYQLDIVDMPRVIDMEKEDDSSFRIMPIE